MEKCSICSKPLSKGSKSGKCKSCVQLGNQRYKNRIFTPAMRKKYSDAKMGDKNPMWRGDKVSYGALHDWVKWHKPKPLICEVCKLKKRLDLANISQKYLRDLFDWEWLCRKCHMEKDGRLAVFRKMHGGNQKCAVEKEVATECAENVVD